MKVVTFEYEKIIRMTELLSKLSFSGFSAANVMAEVGTIIESGQIGEMEVKKDNGSENSTSHS